MNKTLVNLNPAAWVDQFFHDIERNLGGQSGGFSPSVDVVEERDAYVLHAELPGVPRENISVEIKDNQLFLSGKKESVVRGEEGKYRYVESRYGSFSRSFELPRNVKADAIEAEYKDGILNLRIPKADEARPRAIEIR